MDRPACRIEAATAAHLTELSRLYIAYRVFYGEAPEQERAEAFIRDRVTQSSGRYFLAWNDTSPAIGFMHLMPSTNTLAMRPIWFLEDLYVDVSARGQGVATALLSYAEEFARSTGAERLPWLPPTTTWRPSIFIRSWATCAKSILCIFIVCCRRETRCCNSNAVN
jgi:GNAT superfamily N-acetyltransferase